MSTSKNYNFLKNMTPCKKSAKNVSLNFFNFFELAFFRVRF